MCLVACKRDRVEQPATPPPAVHIRRLSPVIGERIGYRISSNLKLVLAKGEHRLEAGEQTDIEANEVIEAVQDGIVRARTITFVKFVHQPLGADAPLPDVVSGKTYRWTGTPDPAWTDAERRAISHYARRDTGQPDLATFALTDRDFTRGEAYMIPTDQPAPFLRGTHGGASIKLDTIENDVAVFRITQVVALELDAIKAALALEGGVTMNIGTARIESIALEGHVTPGPEQIEAHMTSLQTFTYGR